jgi:ribosomal protein L37AE/L43A
MDIGSISALFSSLKTATDIAKIIKESDVSLEKAESKLKLAKLISTLADAKIEVTEIQQVLLDKDAELRKLKDQLEVRAKLEWEKPYYWLVEDSQKEGPFCQHCYDKSHELIRLQGSGGYWECKACKSSYIDSSYVAPSRTASPLLRYDPYDK